MDHQQQDWINKLLARGDVDARIFGVETRMSENEEQQHEETRMFKEVIKKFIYAVE